jgi:hypothetical protein
VDERPASAREPLPGDPRQHADRRAVQTPWNRHPDAFWPAPPSGNPF